MGAMVYYMGGLDFVGLVDWDARDFKGSWGALCGFVGIGCGGGVHFVGLGWQDGGACRVEEGWG